MSHGMGFAQQYTRPFTQEGVSQLKLAPYGVYGISAGPTWVYVGKGNIRERLLGHLKGDNACIRSQRPTHYVFEITETSNAGSRQRELIVELSPICASDV